MLSRSNITYYLGAGASAKALPTTKGTSSSESLPVSFRLLANELLADSKILPKYRELRKSIINNLYWLADKSEENGSLDTFAKYLYYNKSLELETLKKTLSLYFSIRQILHKKTDDRALGFLTEVMKKRGTFPPNIKIISWNYDFQLQLAAENFRKEDLTFDGQQTTFYPGLFQYYPSLGYFTVIDELSLVHLNGIAGFHYAGMLGGLNQFRYKKPGGYNDFFESYLHLSESKDVLLTFGWEEVSKDSDFLGARLNYAKSIIKNTNILVVIGYSFPPYNSEIDKQMFDSMKKGKKLKKIYFQDPLLNGQFLRDQFKLGRSVEIEHISQKENYFIPQEVFRSLYSL